VFRGPVLVLVLGCWLLQTLAAFHCGGGRRFWEEGNELVQDLKISCVESTVLVTAKSPIYGSMYVCSICEVRTHSLL
jgi:hypothetical protein